MTFARIRRAAAGVVFPAVLTLAVAADEGPNLLENPGFEQGTVGQAPPVSGKLGRREGLPVVSCLIRSPISDRVEHEYRRLGSPGDAEQGQRTSHAIGLGLNYDHGFIGHEPARVTLMARTFS